VLRWEQHERVPTFRPWVSSPAEALADIPLPCDVGSVCSSVGDPGDEEDSGQGVKRTGPHRKVGTITETAFYRIEDGRFKRAGSPFRPGPHLGRGGRVSRPGSSWSPGAEPGYGTVLTPRFRLAPQLVPVPAQPTPVGHSEHEAATEDKDRGKQARLAACQVRVADRVVPVGWSSAARTLATWFSR